MIIDCHAHLVPPSLLEAIRSQAAQFPSIRQIEDGGSLGFSFAGGKPTRPVSKPLSDLPARLKWMDEQKIERQAAVVRDQPHAGKLRRILADRGQQLGRHQMGVAIDDH